MELKLAGWELILPYLRENEKLLGISVEDDLLTVNGAKRSYQEVCRKVKPIKADVLKMAEMEREEVSSDDEPVACRPV